MTSRIRVTQVQKQSIRRMSKLEDYKGHYGLAGYMALVEHPFCNSKAQRSRGPTAFGRVWHKNEWAGNRQELKCVRYSHGSQSKERS